MALSGVLDYPSLVWDVATGAKRQELEALRQDLAAQKKQIDGMTAAVATMPDGPMKDKAWALRVKAHTAWMPVVKQFNDAAIAHNDISAKIKAASLGAYDPGRVGTSLMGLGLVPVAVWWIAGIVAGSSAILYALATLIDSIKSSHTEVKGYLEQFADVVNAGGGVIGQTSNLLHTLTNAGLVAVGLYGVYYVARWWQDSRGKKSVATSLAGAAS